MVFAVSVVQESPFTHRFVKNYVMIVVCTQSYTIYYILYIIYYILYNIYYILYTIYYILYTFYYILYNICGSELTDDMGMGKNRAKCVLWSATISVM